MSIVEQEKIYVGAVGVVITLATEKDLSSATTTEIHVKKPDGTAVEWLATVENNESLVYTTVEDDLDIPGNYVLHAYAEWLDLSKSLGNSVVLKVYAKYT